MRRPHARERDRHAWSNGQDSQDAAAATMYLGTYRYIYVSSRVVVDLRYGRLTSELISLSVGSELTFYAVLDSFSARGHGKNCPVKIFEVYVEILGVLYFG